MFNFFSAVANFFKKIFNFQSNENNLLLIEENSSETKSRQPIETGLDILRKLKISIRRFENFFPDKYQEYLNIINVLETKWNADFENYEQSMNSDSLAIAINPNENIEFNAEIISLKNEIECFIETDVLFAIISSRLDKYIGIVKNLYNSICKDINSRYIPERIREATDKLDEIMQEVIKSDDECNAIKSNNELFDKFYEAKYWVAKIMVITSDMDSLEFIFEEDERTNYISHLFNELDSFKKRINALGSDLRYDKLKLDLSRVSNLNFIMPQEAALISKKFWLDFFEIEKTIAKEEKYLKKHKAKKLSTTTISDTSILANHFSTIKLKVKTEEICDMNNIATSDLADWLDNVSISNEKIEIVSKIFRYINSNIPISDAYFFFTLFEIRHIIFDEIIVCTNPKMFGLKHFFEKKYVDSSYDKLHIKKQAVIDSKSEQSKYLKVLSFLSEDECTEIFQFFTELLIDAILVDLQKEFAIGINKVYFSDASYLSELQNTN